MFSHVRVGTNEFERAEAFYGALCDALGLPLGSLRIPTDLCYF